MPEPYNQLNGHIYCVYLLWEKKEEMIVKNDFNVYIFWFDSLPYNFPFELLLLLFSALKHMHTTLMDASNKKTP